MFEETIEYLLFAPDLRALPLWAAFQSSFWIKIEFWVITLSQALACTWFLLCRLLVPSNGFHKNQKKVCASDDHGKYKNSDFCGFGPWFLDNNKHRKVKICFFLYNLSHIFRKWKRKCFNNVLDTYICFQSSNFIQWVTFCPKRAKMWAPISWERVGILGKKFTKCQLSSFSTKYVTENEESLKTSFQALPYFAWISQKMALNNVTFVLFSIIHIFLLRL